jgi:hypothetical protein
MKIKTAAILLAAMAIVLAFGENPFMSSICTVFACLYSHLEGALKPKDGGNE